MPFRLIKGTFVIQRAVGLSDAITFRAASHESWSFLPGPQPNVNADSLVRIQFEGLNTPEPIGSGSPNQNSKSRVLAQKAIDFVRSEFGFGDPFLSFSSEERRPLREVQVFTRNGYILTHSVDRVGRPVAFAYVGDCELRDGSFQELDLDWLKRSLNYSLVSLGMAYPTYYEAICGYIDLRDAISAAARQASSAKLGVWRFDCSREFVVEGKGSIADNQIIFPKLCRRISKYLDQHNNDVLGFKNWLRERNEKVLVLSIGFIGTFDEIIFQEGRRVSMTTTPDDLVFGL